MRTRLMLLPLLFAAACLSVTPRQSDRGAADVPPMPDGTVDDVPFPETADDVPGPGDPGDDPGTGTDVPADVPADPGPSCPAVTSFAASETHVAVGQPVTLSWTLTTGTQAPTVTVEPDAFQGYLVTGPGKAATFTFPDTVDRAFRTTPVTFRLAGLGCDAAPPAVTVKVLGSVWMARYDDKVHVYSSAGRDLDTPLSSMHLRTPWALLELPGGRVLVGNRYPDLSAAKPPVAVFGTDGTYLYAFPEKDKSGGPIWQNTGGHAFYRDAANGDVWVGGITGRVLGFHDEGTSATYKGFIALDIPNRSAEAMIPLSGGRIAIVYGGSGSPGVWAVQIVDSELKVLESFDNLSTDLPLGVTCGAAAGGNAVVLGGLYGTDGYLAEVRADRTLLRKGGPFADVVPRHSMVPFGAGWLAIVTDAADLYDQAVHRVHPDLTLDPTPFAPPGHNTWRGLMVLGGN
jgi:hypothetical protein